MSPINRVAGQKDSLRMEYFEATGGAVAELRWQSASQAKQIVPTGRRSAGKQAGAFS